MEELKNETTAIQFKQRSFNSIKEETQSIYKLIEEAADKGLLSISDIKISDAAKVLFTDRGFKVRITLTPGTPMSDLKNYSISWD